MIGPDYVYRAYAERVHDGDTFQLRVDLGFDVAISVSCRLYGVNAPELGTDAGRRARDFVRELLRPANVRWEQRDPRCLLVKTYKDTRSFARWVCEVWYLADANVWEPLGQDLITAGHATSFDPKKDVWVR